MVLLDTNVVSELRKGPRADPGVAAFHAALVPHDVYLAAQTIGELRCGVERIRKRGDRPQASRLEHWLDDLVAEHASRILGFDGGIAQLWGCLMSTGPQHPIDKQIAAIALTYDLTVATRNVADFEGCGVRLLNPFVGTGASH